MVETLLQEAVTAGVFPGGQLLVVDAGQTVLRYAFGRLATTPESGPPTTLDTIYDVASLTKVAATTAVIMRLVEDGLLPLEARARRWLPEVPAATADYTIRQLLDHSAGLLWWRAFYELPLPLPLPGAPTRREAMLRLAAAEPLVDPPGTRAVYSDLGFILLGFIIERITGERLDVAARRLVFEPLGMERTGFVDLEAVPPAPRPTPVAPTELCPRRGLLVGEVHDDNCHAAGGILGHAGLFSTADDLSRLVTALVAPLSRGPDDPRALLVREFCRPSAVPGSTRRLGWDGPSPGVGTSQAGDRWPRQAAIGHGGYTGTSIWVDLRRKRWVILLTNRVHPSRTDERIKQVRPRVHDAIVTMLDG